jgi:carboxylesterase 2
MLHNYLLFVALAVFTIVWSAPLNDRAANPTISIASGVVIGTAIPFTPDPAASAPTAASSVFQYLSIPFAAAPTGTLRFAPPVTPTAWTQALQATALPPACLQQYSGR